MQVSVETVSGKLITVDVESSETIRYIKVKMQQDKTELVKVEMQQDTKQDKKQTEDEDGSSVKDCFQIYVKNPNENTIPLEVQSSDTVYGVKAKIRDKVGYSPGRQVLFSDEEKLGNEKTLAEYDIQNESIVNLRLSPFDIGY